MRPQSVDQVSRLKRAAIDAYMADEGLRIWPGDRHFYRRPAWDASTLFYVSTPDSYGNGGGDIIVSEPQHQSDLITGNAFPETGRPAPPRDYFYTKFDDIRQRIDQLVEPWKGLPSARSIEPIVFDFKHDVVKLLSLDANSTGAMVTGLMGGFVQTLEIESAKLSGDTADAYNKLFVRQVRNRLANLEVIAASLTVLMAAQQGIWEDAGVNFRNLLDEACDKFYAVAAPSTSGSDTEWIPTAFTIVATVATVVGMCLPPTAPAAATVGVGLIGLTATAGGLAADASLSDTPEAKSGPAGSYGEIIKLLETNVGNLNDQIRMLEDNIHTEAESLIGDKGESAGIGYDTAGYTVPNDVIAIDSTEADQIKMDGETIRFLAGTMRDIGREIGLASGAAKSWQSEIRSAVLRDDRIGRGDIGPSWAVQGLNEAFCDRLDDLAAKLGLGAANLEAVGAYHEQRTEEMKSDLNDLAALIQEGTGIDPSDYSKSEIGYSPLTEGWIDIMNGIRIRHNEP